MFRDLFRGRPAWRMTRQSGTVTGEANGLTIAPPSALSGALAAVCAVGALACAQNAVAEHLYDAVRAALRKNPEVLAAAAGARAAGASYDQAGGGRYPSIDLRVGAGKEESDNVALRSAGIGTRTLTRQESSLTLRQNVFDGAQVSSEVERQNFRLESSRSRLRETGEIIALRTAEAYLDALRDQGLVRLAEDNVLRHEELLDKTQLRFKSGVGQRADVEQAAARVALARSGLASARGAAEDSAARYQRVVGRAASGLTDPPAPLRRPPPSLAVAKSMASEASYGILSARAEVGAAQAGVRATRADLLPRVDVELSANRLRDADGLPGPNNDNLAMLVMRYNLFRGGADDARIREAIERETIAMETLINAERATEESVARAWAALVAARERIAPLEAHARASEQVQLAYRDQFELGRRSLLDLVNAQNELFQARSSLLSGRSAERVNEYRVLAAIGVLVSALGLEEEVSRLDPGPKDK
jgi:adhesin transport system outer membrane protein